MNFRSKFFVIHGGLPSQNEWVYANRTSWYIGNDMKKKAEGMVESAVREQFDTHDHFMNPVEIEYRFFEYRLNRDLDNITSFAAKVVQDTLVKLGILRNDTPKYIKRMISSVYRDKDDPRIEIMIREVE